MVTLHIFFDPIPSCYSQNFPPFLPLMRWEIKIDEIEIAPELDGINCFETTVSYRFSFLLIIADADAFLLKRKINSCL